jgi:negative regulator of flagellin synthesis FlgM
MNRFFFIRQAVISMKINETGRLFSIQAYRNQAQAAKEAQQVTKSKQARDNVKISEEAKKLLETQRAQANDRTERIEQLKKQVQSGTYKVSAEKLAEKLWPFLK